MGFIKISDLPLILRGSTLILVLLAYFGVNTTCEGTIQSAQSSTRSAKTSRMGQGVPNGVCLLGAEEISGLLVGTQSTRNFPGELSFKTWQALQEKNRIVLIVLLTTVF